MQNPPENTPRIDDSADDDLPDIVDLVMEELGRDSSPATWASTFRS